MCVVNMAWPSCIANNYTNHITWWHNSSGMKSFCALMLVSLFQMFKTHSSVSTESVCDLLQCQHSCPCMIINELSSNGSYIARAKCLCIGSYVGKNCEGKLSISETIAKTTSVSFRVQISSSMPISDPAQYVPEDITVHYWQNHSQLTCSIFTGKMGKILTIQNLLPETLYTLCVVNGNVNYCSFHDEQLNSSLSCIEISTPLSDSEEMNNDKEDEEWILPVIAVCSVMVILSSVCLCSVANCRKRSKVHLKNKDSKGQQQSLSAELDLFLPQNHMEEYVPNASNAYERNMNIHSTFPRSVPVVRPPNTPGRPPHKMSQQSMGYSSFTLRNSKSLSLNTVLECSGEECPRDNEIDNLISSNKENI